MRLLFFLLFPFILFGKGFTAKAELLNSTATLTETVDLKLTLSYPTDSQPDYDSIKANLISTESFSQSPFALKKVITLSKKEKKGIIEEKILYSLDPQLVGKQYLSFFSIPFLGEEPQQVITDVFSVEITSSSSAPSPLSIAPLMTFSTAYPMQVSWDNQQKWVNPPKEIFAQKQLELWEERLFPWKLTLSIFVSTAVIFLFWKLRRPLKKEPSLSQVRDRTLKKIQSLDLKKMNHRLYYQTLGSLLRGYLERRFSYPFTKATRKEISTYIKKEPLIPTEKKEQVIQLFEQLERLKFSQEKEVLNLQQKAEEALHL